MGLLMTLTREADSATIKVPKAAVVNIEPRPTGPGTRLTLSSGGLADVAEDIATVAALFEAD
ncbi:hypothetical protein [Bradyrhizobium valentinum]|uniref:Uncharacterized protein n=1 Tax=Bradyrhizobium valentinum TaxID=1518501 RepID=A0A0R3LU14_9BRAD|nr:hypothetical protein [Bradyrhizobium valentinum]KRR11543.1 hypothetical protein CP49_18075 [Bradyrhizobium valentinum]